MFGKQLKNNSLLNSKRYLLELFPDSIRSPILSEGAKDTFTLIIGAIFSTLSGFFITLLVARKFTADEFGQFITALSFSQLVIGISDLGISSAGLKFISSQNNDERLKAIKTTFILRVGSAVIVSIIIYSLSFLISKVVFKNPNMLFFIQISSIGIFLQLVISWGQILFQSQRKFIHSSIASNSINVLRFAVAVVLLIPLSVPINYLFIAFQLVLIIPLLFVFKNSNKGFINIDTSLTDYRKITNFAIPLGVSAAAIAIYSRLDQVVVFSLAGSAEAGIYGLSSRIFFFFMFISYALNSVVVPRLTHIDEKAFPRFFKKVVYVASLLVLINIGGIVFAPLVIPLIFGVKFINSIIPFQILAIAAIFYTFSLNINSVIIYYFKVSKFMLYLSLGSLPVILFALYYLTLALKSTGAALAVAIVFGLQLIASVSYFSYLYLKNE